MKKSQGPTANGFLTGSEDAFWGCDSAPGYGSYCLACLFLGDVGLVHVS